VTRPRPPAVLALQAGIQCAAVEAQQVRRRARAEFGKLLADETEKWAKVVKFANISVE